MSNTCCLGMFETEFNLKFPNFYSLTVLFGNHLRTPFPQVLAMPQPPSRVWLVPCSKKSADSTRIRCEWATTHRVGGVIYKHLKLTASLHLKVDGWFRLKRFLFWGGFDLFSGGVGLFFLGEFKCVGIGVLPANPTHFDTFCSIFRQSSLLDHPFFVENLNLDETDEAGDDERNFSFRKWGAAFLELKNFLPQKDHGGQ